jgi:acetyl esterase/lipase
MKEKTPQNLFHSFKFQNVLENSFFCTKSRMTSNNMDTSLNTTSVPVPPPPCVSVSEQAREFMNESYQYSWTSEAIFTQEAVDTLRRDNSQAASRACLESLHVTTCDEIIGGVSVQWVIPSTEKQLDAILLFFFGGAFIVGCPEDYSKTCVLFKHANLCPEI